MRNVLDSIREFGALSDSKVRLGGSLAPPDEKRWEELKAFYDLLMSQSGLPLDVVTSRFSESDIRKHVMDRDRLRVPAEVYAILRDRNAGHAVRVVNLSRSGVYLASETLFEVGSRLCLHLADASCCSEEVLELESEVIWRTARGIPEVDLPRGMGLRFVEPSPETQEKLDSWVVGTLEKQLSGLW